MEEEKVTDGGSPKKRKEGQRKKEFIKPSKSYQLYTFPHAEMHSWNFSSSIRGLFFLLKTPNDRAWRVNTH